jgi:uncharacterized coiled-coil DUF342 family protein
MSEELALLDRILELSVPRIYSAERAGEVAGEKNEAIKALRQRLEALRAERDAYHGAMMTAREAANQFLARAENAEAALREAVEWADRHGKEPSWLDSARAALAPSEAKGGDDGQ